MLGSLASQAGLQQHKHERPERSRASDSCGLSRVRQRVYLYVWAAAQPFQRLAATLSQDVHFQPSLQAADWLAPIAGFIGSISSALSDLTVQGE